jgi:excisionase family DNA binding protein
MSQPRRRGQRAKDASSAGPMLTMREACELLNIHSNTLRKWSRQGIVKAYRVGPGGHRRFRASDLIALLSEQGESSGAPAGDHSPDKASHASRGEG